jgi:hypothetical protein
MAVAASSAERQITVFIVRPSDVVVQRAAPPVGS